MRSRSTQKLFLIILACTYACGRDHGLTTPTPPDPPAAKVLVKDIVIPNLPSPYYHFEYDTAGRVIAASFASELRRYDVVYDGSKLTEMRNNILVNKDRLVYVYNSAGNVSEVTYNDSAGTTYTRLRFAYDGPKLVGLLRERRSGAGFIVDKTISFSYDSDGNLFEIVDHRSAIAGQQEEATFVDRFEQYDAGINVDGFSLIHNEFFDHLVLLPQVQLQQGNPRRETRTGDGVNYTVDYSYVYDEKNRPLTKTGELTITNGPETGRRFQTNSVFSYY